MRSATSQTPRLPWVRSVGRSALDAVLALFLPLGSRQNRPVSGRYSARQFCWQFPAELRHSARQKSQLLQHSGERGIGSDFRGVARRQPAASLMEFGIESPMRALELGKRKLTRQEVGNARG